jgi:hypothetical protein
MPIHLLRLSPVFRDLLQIQRLQWEVMLLLVLILLVGDRVFILVFYLDQCLGIEIVKYTLRQGMVYHNRDEARQVVMERFTMRIEGVSRVKSWMSYWGDVKG